MSTRVVFILAIALLAAGPVVAQDESADTISFHRDVRPLLQARCQGCHQPAKDSGDVVLMSHADLLRELDGVPLVVPGDPGAGLLLSSVTSIGDLPPEMPKDAPPLSAEERGLLAEWVRAGALDDTPENAVALPSAEDPPRYRLPPVVTALAFSPDGAWLAVSGRHEVLLHDVSAIASETPVPARRLIGRSPRIESLAFNDDGSILAAAGGAPGLLGELQLWQPAKGKLLRSAAFTFDTLRGLSWSPDNALVAFGCTDRTLRAVDAATGKQVLFQGAHEDWVLDTTFSLDGSHLISVGRDRSAKLTKVETEQFIDNITSITPGAMKGGLVAAECHPLRDEVLVGGADGEPKLFKIYREKKRQIGDDFNLIRAFEPVAGRITDVAWTADGARFFTCASLSRLADPPRGGSVRCYDTEGAVVWTQTFEGAIYALALEPSERRLAVAGFDGRVRLLDTATGSVQVELVPVPLESAPPSNAPTDPIATEEEPLVIDGGQEESPS